jgi:hypothetical protein
MLSGVPENPSFLVDKLNAGFPPGTEHFNGSIRHMLEYDLKERWTLEDCVRHLFDGMDKRANRGLYQ